jgi:hypothetical protein
MKKFLVVLISGVVIASSVPMDSYAATNVTATNTTSVVKEPDSVASAEPTDKGLEDAILAVKDKITIPKDYSEFNYYFYNANPEVSSFWYMTWSNPKTNSYIQVNCDTNNHITYYYNYDYSKRQPGIAKFLKSELKTKADDFIAKIAPDIKSNLKFVEAEYDGLYSGDYAYYYTRVNNGVEFPDNYVIINVNSVTGEATGASVSWLYDTAVPSSSTKVTKEKAADAIKDNMKMKLVYRSDYYRIYDKNGIANYAKKAFLVYEPTESYISVDAKTGEVYKSRSEWVDTGTRDAGTSNKEESADSAAGSSAALTQEEINKIQDLKNLISKSKAIETITSNPYLYLDKNLTAYSATLSKRDEGNGDTSYQWNISLSDPREVDYSKASDYYRAYASATVDAETGKILSFYTSLKSNYDEVNQKWNTVKIKYDKKAGQEVLEKFLKAQIKDRFANSVLVSQNDDYIAYYKDNTDPVYGGYSYQYNRVNEGVEYPYNYIYGSVDGVTGKIYSYSYYWDNNVTFESTKGAMTAEEAMNYYLGKDGFGLKYEINVINKYDSSYGKDKVYYDYTDAYSVENEIRLVYRPDVNPMYISPFTGEQLTSSGEVYKETKPYSYKDIENTEKNRNILLLADMNIGFDGESFLPYQNITVGEFNDLMEKVGYGYYNTGDDSKAGNLISREVLANEFIVSLGLEKVSKLDGIYNPGFTDQNMINEDYLGAVALAKALGIMKGDSNNNFNPKGNVTRYDAVDCIINFITALQKM